METIMAEILTVIGLTLNVAVKLDVCTSVYVRIHALASDKLTKFFEKCETTIFSEQVFLNNSSWLVYNKILHHLKVAKNCLSSVTGSGRLVDGATAILASMFIQHNLRTFACPKKKKKQMSSLRQLLGGVGDLLLESRIRARHLWLNLTKKRW